MQIKFRIAKNKLYTGNCFQQHCKVVPGHASFGVIMGVWYGLERRYDYWGNKPKRKISQILAFLLPVLMHGTYDFLCTSLYGWQGNLVFVAFILLLFSLSWHMVNKASANDRYL